MTCWLLLAQLFVCYVEIRVRQCHMLCILWPSPLLVRIWQKRRRVMMLTYQLHHNLFIGLLPQAFPNTSDGHFHVFPFFFVYGIIFWQQNVQHEHRPMDIFNMTDGLGVWMQGPLGKSYLYICNVQFFFWFLWDGFPKLWVISARTIFGFLWKEKTISTFQSGRFPSSWHCDT